MKINEKISNGQKVQHLTSAKDGHVVKVLPGRNRDHYLVQFVDGSREVCEMAELDYRR